ncbi:hypothetical protein [Methylobacterium soli]|uniref:Class I SAM-dependent methyltransferase n=1 Tax=Methylobacterium soli TaxID=553447 RepID=A0A6L3SQY6_9HYPH|nr:hypothetical protein [Methylobacterium soli]KAB1070366.1 hypothetical protein F6X53_30185 [Methylobacterium soli]
MTTRGTRKDIWHGSSSPGARDKNSKQQGHIDMTYGIELSLTSLANRYGSDKGNQHESRHQYTYIYDLLFSPMRDSEINFLEMGLARGGPELGQPIDRIVDSPSVSMWLEYFSSAKIFGFDISDFSHIKHDRFTFIRGDSGNRPDLRKVAASAPYFNVIIDDGSHASYHQQLGLKVLFDKLLPGGLYIIEDLHWQSPYFESVLPSVPKTGTFLRELFENNKYLENSLFSEEDAKDLFLSTSAFAVFGHVDSEYRGPKIAILKKIS